MACDRCSCPDICLANPAWCTLAMQPDSPVRDVQVDAFCKSSDYARQNPQEFVPPTPEPEPRDDPAGPKSYPSLLQQAKNFAGAMVDFAASGFKTASQEEQDRRLGICEKCEFFDHAQSRCSRCSCFSKFKNWIAVSHCPLDPPKW